MSEDKLQAIIDQIAADERAEEAALAELQRQRKERAEALSPESSVTRPHRGLAEARRLRLHRRGVPGDDADPEQVAPSRATRNPDEHRSTSGSSSKTRERSGIATTPLTLESG